MKPYIGIKRVKAQPMLAKDAFDAGYNIGECGPDDQGYEVEYKDGHRSWSPAEPFEGTYRETSEEDWDKPAEMPVRTVTVMAPSPRPVGTTGIKYIGSSEAHVDNLYGTGLVWGQGDIHNVAKPVADKMLKHPDVYEECAPAAGGAIIALQGAVETDPDQPQQTYVLPNLEGMDKEALTTFSQQHFGEKLPKTMKEDTMRQRILGLIQERGLK